MGLQTDKKRENEAYRVKQNPLTAVIAAEPKLFLLRSCRHHHPGRQKRYHAGVEGRDGGDGGGDAATTPR